MAGQEARPMLVEIFMLRIEFLARMTAETTKCSFGPTPTGGIWAYRTSHSRWRSPSAANDVSRRICPTDISRVATWRDPRINRQCEGGPFERSSQTASVGRRRRSKPACPHFNVVGIVGHGSIGVRARRRRHFDFRSKRRYGLLSLHRR